MRLDLSEGRVKGDAGRSGTDFGPTVSLRKSGGLVKPFYTPSPAEAEFGDLTAGFGTIQLCL